MFALVPVSAVPRNASRLRVSSLPGTRSPIVPVPAVSSGSTVACALEHERKRAGPVVLHQLFGLRGDLLPPIPHPACDRDQKQDRPVSLPAFDLKKLSYRSGISRVSAEAVKRISRINDHAARESMTSLQRAKACSG